MDAESLHQQARDAGNQGEFGRALELIAQARTICEDALFLEKGEVRFRGPID